MASVEYRQGEVVAAKDELIRILPQRNPQKKEKSSRYLLVVQDPEPARLFTWEVLLCCPIHSDHQATTTWDISLPKGSVPVLDADSWVVIPSLQPVLKSDVKASLGVVSDRVMAEVYRALAGYSGLAEFNTRWRGRIERTDDGPG